MVGDIRADRTIAMGGSISMMMKCKPQNGDRKTNKQE
jgi:hypothetical protein